ncbi:MAG: MerR family transcriptional regulator [Chitinophagaceae bacterium]|nr:MerR family transcriptional regulator [Chitinophagaceae bacterium]MBL0132352.1 MerR family transcriptional regulator [Chitinophagaceae bacterium]
MGKSLSQITFDFVVPEEPVNSPEQSPASIVEETNVLPVLTEIAIKKDPATGLKNDKPVSTRGRRSLKENSIQADLLQIPEDELLFKKQYYAIGEVALMFRENQSLIRYWETEFDILQPRKNRKGDRFFRPVDIKNLVLIYDLLRRRKFTIEGAKEYLKKNKRAEEKFAMMQSLEKIKGFLLELKANL